MFISTITAITLKGTNQASRVLAKVQRPLSNSIPLDVFFIRMGNYKSNINWAADMRCATKSLADMMDRNVDILQIIRKAEESVRNIYLRMNKRAIGYGERKVTNGGCFDLINYKSSRGSEYFERYKAVFPEAKRGEIYIPQTNKQYPDAITCKLVLTENSVSILEGRNNPYNINSNLDLVAKAYNVLKAKSNPSRQDIVETAATIQWLIAQETPYKRGSDSVAALLTRSLLHSCGIKLSPLKKGVSCDFEAFSQNLDDYIKFYPTLFEKSPLLA